MWCDSSCTVSHQWYASKLVTNDTLIMFTFFQILVLPVQPKNLSLHVSKCTDMFVNEKSVVYSQCLWNYWIWKINFKLTDRLHKLTFYQILYIYMCSKLQIHVRSEQPLLSLLLGVKLLISAIRHLASEIIGTIWQTLRKQWQFCSEVLSKIAACGISLQLISGLLHHFHQLVHYQTCPIPSPIKEYLVHQSGVLSLCR